MFPCVSRLLTYIYIYKNRYICIIQRRMYVSFVKYFFKTRGRPPCLSGWYNATPCPVLSGLALSCLDQNTPLTYMLVAVSNTSCKWFAQCRWGILYMCKCEMETHIYWNIMYHRYNKKKNDVSRGKPRQGEAVTRQGVSRCFAKYGT